MGGEVRTQPQYFGPPWGKPCATCGKPVYPPTNRYAPAAVMNGDTVYHGPCAPQTIYDTETGWSHLVEQVRRLETELAKANARADRWSLFAQEQEAEVTAKVREIHQALKRGGATQDHGLMGNLACILDHVLLA